MAKATPAFKTNYNATTFPKNYEINKHPSMTVPDQTMTIAQILERHTRGLPFVAGKVPIYDDNGEDAIWEKLDLAEKMDRIQEAKAELAAAKKAANDRAFKKAVEKQEADILEAAKKLAAEKTATPPPEKP